MFDFAPNPSIKKKIASPRGLALDLLARSGARLRLIAARRGGDVGLAMICAMCDMITDSDVDPLFWPIDDAIDLLRQPAASRDAQADRLAKQLELIRDRIGQDLDSHDA